jgi:hypothetical protein
MNTMITTFVVRVAPRPSSADPNELFFGELETGSMGF